MTTRVRTSVVALAGALAVAPAHAGEPRSSAVDATPMDAAAHWAARSTLANAVMFSGLGEELAMSMSERDAILEHAGYVVRPAMPDMAMVGAIYAAGGPAFVQEPDFARPETLCWDPASFDRTLDPGAQAWTLIKITSPEFHLNFHERKEDKRAALLMLPQAEVQARTLGERLRTRDGLFAALSPEGEFAEPRPLDQAAVLWGVSNLILAASSERDDYWHRAYRDLVDPDDWRGLAEAAFAAVQKLSPERPGDRAIAIEALGRFALATDDADQREVALRLAGEHAHALAEVGEASLGDSALAVYGLIEGGRLLGDPAYADAAAELLRARLLPSWNDELGAFAPAEKQDAITYTPRTLGALVAALDAMRWHGPADLADEADRLYASLLEAVLVRAGLLRSSPLPLVPTDYQDALPDRLFDLLPAPGEAGVAPVFAGEVRHEDGAWQVRDPMFRTADAMFLASMLVMPNDGRADAFLPADRLAGLAK